MKRQKGFGATGLIVVMGIVLCVVAWGRFLMHSYEEEVYADYIAPTVPETKEQCSEQRELTKRKLSQMRERAENASDRDKEGLTEHFQQAREAALAICGYEDREGH